MTSVLVLYSSLMEKKNTFLKFYLLVISIVATLGIVGSFGWLAYSSLNHLLISDEEYVQGRYYWNYDNCSTEISTYPERVDTNGNSYTDYNTTPTITKPTEEEIALCEEKALADATKERNYEFKQALITEITWLLVFVILFVTHFPFFLRQNKEKN